jgi:hypothetical protein
MPAMVSYVARILADRDDSRADAILRYLRDRRALNIDSFRIMFVWNAIQWSDEILQDFSEDDDVISPLFIHIVRISDLRPLVERTYAGVSIAVDEDDD